MATSQAYGSPFTVTATNATLASAAQAGVANTRYYITDISVSSDKAGSIVLVKSGTTVIWQDIVGVGAYGRRFETPLMGVIGALVSVEIDGTAAAKANLIGYAITTS